MGLSGVISTAAVAIFYGASESVRFRGPLSLSPYINGAQWGVASYAATAAFGNWVGNAAAAIPAVILYLVKANLQERRLPPTGWDMLAYPSIAAVVALLANSTITWNSKALLPTSVALLVVLVQFVIVVRGAVGIIVYPAPIVSDFFLPPAEVEKERARLLDPKSNTHLIQVPVWDFDDATGEATRQVGMIDVAVYVAGGTERRQLGSGHHAIPPRWMVYFGGNGQVLESTAAGVFQLGQHMTSQNVNVVVYNHRGVGRSTGTIRGARDLQLDGEAVARYIAYVATTGTWEPVMTPPPSRTLSSYLPEFDQRNVLLFGHSIGGAVASHLASGVLSESSLILDRTFDTLIDAAKTVSPIRHEGLNAFALPYLFGNLDNVKNFKAVRHERKFILYHRHDQIVRFPGCSMGRREKELSEASTLPLHIFQLQGPSKDPHNTSLFTFMNGGSVLATIRAKIGWP